jgi:hypothetical protein
MTELINTLSIFGDPWLTLAWLALAVALLEAERWWTRRRRRRGRHVGVPAYILDALALAGAVLAVASGLALLARGIITVAQLAGELLGWPDTQARAYSWLPIAIIAAIVLIAVGVRLAHARLHRTRIHRELNEQKPAAAGVLESSRADLPIARPASPQPLAQPTSAMSQLPPLVIAPPLAQATAAPTVSTPRVIIAQIDEPTEALSSLSMLGHNRRSYIPAVPQPQSFLTSPPEVDKRRPRVRLALATLALIGLSLGGLVFRTQIAGLLLALRPATSEVTAAALSLPTSEPVISGEPALAPAIPTAPTLVSRHVKSDTLNLRARPGIDQQVIAKLARGASVLLLGERMTVEGRTWVRVRAGEQEGWVSQDLLE